MKLSVKLLNQRGDPRPWNGPEDDGAYDVSLLRVVVEFGVYAGGVGRAHADHVGK